MAKTKKIKLEETKSSTNKIEALLIDKLRWKCPIDIFKFNSTKDLEPLTEIVGQPRAIEAIRMGAELNAKGYNIFVTGLSGTGRLSTVKNILEQVTSSCPLTYDYCYVNNFKNEDEPLLIKLNKGKGKELASAMDDAVSFLRRRIPKLFEEESYQQSKRKIIDEYQTIEREVLTKFDDKIRPEGFIRGQLEIENGAVQPEVFPVIEGKAVQIESIEELIAEGKLNKERAEQLKILYRQYHNEVFDLMRDGLKIMQEFRKALAENDKHAAQTIVNSVLDQITQQFDTKAAASYISEVKEYILEHLNIFSQTQTPSSQTGEIEDNDGNEFRLFSVNVILDNSETVSAPVVTETTPSYNNLFGSIERVFDKRGGYWKTDFTKIKAGSLLKADQGYLIVNANDLFTEPGVWNALKRVLLYDKLDIQPYDAYFQFSQASLKPEAINVDVKVIIIGGLSLYQTLFHYEKGFKKIFKVHAQFDYETDINEEMLLNYAHFISKICRDENLAHCEPDAVGAILEWAAEAAGSQNKLTLKFSDVADIIREAAFYDRGSNTKNIQRQDVLKAIEWRRRRNDLLDEKIKRSILIGDMLIDTKGERIGQINGLTVYSNGLISFGKPARITASISAGNAGIINIEREADMSGSIHNKGMMIINGFLREKFAANRPMSLTASIAFEQSYGGIDGDSASAAEIYILLSALAKVPIKQNFAITGSVNQKGDIQPIGGVNEKIRGFYEVCKERGFTGDQGVIIPAQNVKDLMLCEEVINDIKIGNFYIYAINNIEQGSQILMGISAGEPDSNGKYPADTLYSKVEKRLEELHNFVLAANRPQALVKKVKRKTKTK